VLGRGLGITAVGVRFPDVQFVAAGSALDKSWENSLREKYGGLPNLELHGRIDQFAEPERHSALLARSRMMVNTSTRKRCPTPSWRRPPTAARSSPASTAEVVGDTGLLVPPHDVEALRTALTRLTLERGLSRLPLGSSPPSSPRPPRA
jgi:glycosyltransferase involved in cell wall biosynthesis